MCLTLLVGAVPTLSMGSLPAQGQQGAYASTGASDTECAYGVGSLVMHWLLPAQVLCNVPGAAGTPELQESMRYLTPWWAAPGHHDTCTRAPSALCLQALHHGQRLSSLAPSRLPPCSAPCAPLQVLHYVDGQKYEPHHDFFHDTVNARPENGGQRVATVLMYL